MADVFTHFNYLHTIPEIGMKEFKTSAYVADVLKQLGYEVETQIGGATGVVAVCDSGKPGPVLGLRADMDALGTKDGGAAHLCGHGRTHGHASCGGGRNHEREAGQERETETSFPAGGGNE